MPVLVTRALASSLGARSTEAAPIVFGHGLASLECGAAGGGFPVLELSPSPLACDEPRDPLLGTLVARTAGGTITESDGVVRYDVTSGEQCTGRRARGSSAAGSSPRDARAPEAIYRIEPDDGSFAAGSMPVTRCSSTPCL